MNIAIIPARGGSKRIPRKNIRHFCGKPMIAWSIEAALQSELFAQVIVSTDCPEIAEVARQHGASTPFARPAEMSDDFTPTIPVVRHAIDWLTERDESVGNVCCVYATAPFVQTNDLSASCQMLESDTELEFVFPVAEFGSSIFRSLKLEDGRVKMFWPEHELTRTQDLPVAYHDVGQFYWGTAAAYRQHTGFYSARSSAIVLPAHRVQDIDTEADWARAEIMFRALHQEQAEQSTKARS